MQAIIELSDGAKIPIRKTIGSSGLDLHTNKETIIKPFGTAILPTGVSLQIEQGYEAQVRPRSGNSTKGILIHFGTIDSDYIGEIGIICTNLTPVELVIHEGNRMAQLVFAKVETVDFIEAYFNETTRGANGFGHTGIN